MLVTALNAKAIRYFEEQVLRKGSYLKCEWYERALCKVVRREVQPDGRIRHWIFIPELGEYLRDSETVHNAFLNRRVKGGDSYGWVLDMDELQRHIHLNTKAIVLNTPHKMRRFTPG